MSVTGKLLILAAVSVSLYRQDPEVQPHVEEHTKVRVDRLGNVIIDGQGEFVLVYRPGEFTDLGAIAAATGSRCAASYMNATDDSEVGDKTVICMPPTLNRGDLVAPPNDKD